MRRLLLLLALLAAAPARADVDRALDTVILPGVARFAAEAGALSAAAEADCRREALRPAYDAARDAWSPVGDFRLGPTETAALTIAFWPDDRASGLRALRAAVAGPVPKVALLPATARGFAGLDLLLGDADLAYGPDDPACALARALAADLAAQAEALAAGWQDYAPLLRDPGAPGNTAYLDETEALRALYTQALGVLEMTQDARLGRPLGEPGRPRPTRAEAWRTARSLPNALAAARAAHALATALSDAPLPEADNALAGVEAAGRAIRDPAFQDIADRQARLRLEALAQRVGALHDAIAAEVGGALGIKPGFNSLDGD
jgi:predicted lipoprotein